MSSANVITEFLASVGFKADEKSLKASLAKVAAFGAGMQLLAVGIYAGLVKVASGEAEIARKAEMLGTTSEKLQELGYVAEQSNSSIEAMNSTLDALGKKYPRIKDSTKLLERAGERMRNMSEEQRRFYADNMGIDRSLIPMLISDTSKLTDEFRSMYAVAGHDAKQAAQASKEFKAEIGKLTAMAGILAKSIALAFIGRIRHDIATLRRVLMENFDKIKRAFEMFIKVVLRVASVISSFVYRVVTWVGALVSWYDKLDDGQKKLVLGVGLLAAAWKLLNAGFLATPLGLIITGLAGIVALIDDYLTYMEGGESYFDWGPWSETIEKARKILSKTVGTVVNFITENKALFTSLGKGLAVLLAFKKGVGIIQMLIGAFKAFNRVIKLNPIGFLLSLFVMAAVAIIDNWDAVKESFLNVWEAIKEKAKAVADFFLNIWKGIGDWFSSMWDRVLDAFPNFGAWASSAVGSIKNIFGSGIQFIKDKIKNLVSFLPDWVLEKMGLKPGGEEDSPTGDDPYDDPEFNQALNNALLASEATNRPALTPSPAQASSMTNNSKQDIHMDAKTDIHVHTSDPVTAGKQVAARQSQVNADTVRHMKGAVK